MRTFLTLVGSLLTTAILVSFAPQHNVRPEVPQMLSFSATPRFENEMQIFGQTVDLSRYDLHERFERELTGMCYTHNNTILTIKRANRIFPQIVPILLEEGVPEDLKYLCCIESSLNPRALSPAKAAGLWQFMAATAKEMGLQVDDEVDERYHTEKATRAACKYFKNAYKKFGDWNNVAASYNGGQAGLSSKLSAQDETLALDLLLPEETSRYMFRIMAMKEIMQDPYHYGFVLYSDQLYRPIATEEVTVTRTIPDLTKWAKEHGCSYYQLKEFNPWLRANKLTVRPGKQYTILLPKAEDMYYDDKPFVVYDTNWIVDKQ